MHLRHTGNTIELPVACPAVIFITDCCSQQNEMEEEDMSAHGSSSSSSRSYQRNSGVATETDDASDDVTTPVEENCTHTQCWWEAACVAQYCHHRYGSTCIRNTWMCASSLRVMFWWGNTVSLRLSAHCFVSLLDLLSPTPVNLNTHHSISRSHNDAENMLFL